jgi:hypothetical protein
MLEQLHFTFTDLFRAGFPGFLGAAAVIRVRWSKFLSGKFFSWRKSWAKAHTDRPRF